MNHSETKNKKSKNCFFFALILLIGAIGLCGILFLIIYYCPSTYGPIKDYPGANDIQFTEEESYPIYTKTTSYWTEDSPEKVYRFYRRQFLFCPYWRYSESDKGLEYSFSLGCPVGGYSIQAQKKNDRTYVIITLKTSVCI